jgi:asparagine synthase (glutamine-hydrolysing)
MILDLYPGTMASGRSFAPAAGERADWSAWHAMAEREAQFYNLIQVMDASLRIESDPIGLKPFYLAQLAHGTLVASRILDILSTFPDLARPVDPLAAYELMMFRAPMADRTLHRRIRRSVAGGCYAWDPARGLRVTRERRLTAPPVDGSLFVDETLTRLKQVLLRSLAEKTAGLSGPIAISLSGGFDSRLLAAMAIEVGLPVRAFSFGRRYHREIQSAKATAGTLGIPLQLLPYPTDGSLRRLPFHLKTVEGTADLATSLIANLFAIECPTGAAILHGFAGDPLAGNHLRHLTPQDYRSLDRLADGVMRFNGGSAPVDVDSLLHVDVPREAVRDEIRSNLREGCAPHQAYLLWDFENKQRRYVGAHFPMIGTRFDPVAPYYDRELFALWLSVPPIGLDERSLFRKFLSRFYPALARIPHSEEAGPITPNLRYQLSHFLRQAPYDLADRVMGAGWAARTTRSLSRDRYIWSLANLAGTHQHAHMLARIAALRSEMRLVLDLDVDAAFADRLQGDLQATRGLFLIAEYAAWLRRQLPA